MLDEDIVAAIVGDAEEGVAVARQDVAVGRAGLALGAARNDLGEGAAVDIDREQAAAELVGEFGLQVGGIEPQAVIIDPAKVGDVGIIEGAIPTKRVGMEMSAIASAKRPFSVGMSKASFWPEGDRRGPDAAGRRKNSWTGIWAAVLGGRVPLARETGRSSARRRRQARAGTARTGCFSCWASAG
ncbi:hypothetical protein LP419_10045 [Massilia sp. H-1]|nr:hypothetical protein LP419_10045 [Massilia sp. H-1]